MPIFRILLIQFLLWFAIFASCFSRNNYDYSSFVKYSLMASPSSASNPTHNSTNNNNPSSGYAAFEPNTTFVQANPSNFKSIVQKLTGLSPPTPRFAGKSNFGEMGPRGTPFKLHERRQTSRKLEINLADGNGIGSGSGINQMGFLGFGSGGSGVGEMVSPVSPLEIFGKVSPQSPYCDSEQEAKNKKDEEMKEISEKEEETQEDLFNDHSFCLCFQCVPQEVEMMSLPPLLLPPLLMLMLMIIALQI
ncbi:hypothetical protein M9H77_29256 [Catharanthus roseus]|uniref:Uncharacterized protein n=1 Tax=Catharanthus roseus TaxID=4058 RepID=A0ACC0AHP7_CATRO|nr:hypothetical protein M9H77_29256 [Catharanthus roseus]